MDHVLRARLRKRKEVLIVRFVIEHRRAREPARPQLVVEIDVLRILREVIEAILHLPVLFDGERQRNEFDVVRFDEVVIEVAGRIGRQGESICHN